MSFAAGADDFSSDSSCADLSYIEHPVSKMDTLAGVAIKYGVEVADIKRINGLATDLQMFALRTLQIPPPRRHPPSPSLSNGSVSLGKMLPHLGESKMVQSYQSPRPKTPQRNVSSAMSSLQNFYGLKAPDLKGAAEGTEMAIYKKESPLSSAKSFLPKTSPIPNVLFLANGRAMEADSGVGTPEKLLREESSGGSNGFSGITGKGLALRPKSGSRGSLSGGTNSGHSSSSPVGRVDSLANGLTDQEPNNGLFVWSTSKWNLKPDLQALSSTVIARPLFDGLPKPIMGLWNKAARD